MGLFRKVVDGASELHVDLFLDDDDQSHPRGDLDAELTADAGNLIEGQLVKTEQLASA